MCLNLTIFLSSHNLDAIISTTLLIDCVSIQANSVKQALH